MGIDDDAILLMLTLNAKKAKSMATLPFNEVEEAIYGGDVRLLVTRQSDVINVTVSHISFNCVFSRHQ